MAGGSGTLRVGRAYALCSSTTQLVTLDGDCMESKGELQAPCPVAAGAHLSDWLSFSTLVAADCEPSCLWVRLYNVCYCNDEPVGFPIQSSPSKAIFTCACAAAMLTIVFHHHTHAPLLSL